MGQGQRSGGPACRTHSPTSPVPTQPRPACPTHPLPLLPAVVLTSSLAAVSADFSDQGEGHVYSEADWNTSFVRAMGEDAYFT